jgi:hypothetical protein
MGRETSATRSGPIRQTGSRQRLKETATNLDGAAVEVESENDDGGR